MFELFRESIPKSISYHAGSNRNLKVYLKGATRENNQGKKWYKRTDHAVRCVGIIGL
jgi:hypothetical protein